MLIRIARRILAMGLRESLIFVFCRFRPVRQIGRLFRSGSDHASIVPDQNEFVHVPSAPSEFSLKKDGLATGLELSPEVVAELLELEKSAEIYSLGTIDPRIYGRGAISAYNASTDKPVCRAKVQSPDFDILCDRIARNPNLLALVRQSIGGIREINIRTEWSLVVDADTAWRELQNRAVGAPPARPASSQHLSQQDAAARLSRAVREVFRYS